MHPFRHELDAAHARIAQLEDELEAAHRRTETTVRPPPIRVRLPTPFFLMLGCLAVGVAFSFSAVSRISEGTHCHMRGVDATNVQTALVRVPEVTVSPRGLSTWQIANVVSRRASALQLACGAQGLSGDVSVALEIDALGDVASAKATGPASLSSCVEASARTWKFPPSDGATHTSVPVAFRPTMAMGAPQLRVPAEPPPTPDELGSIAVTCAPQCDAVLEDGRPLGRAPIVSHPTRAGRHVLELVSGTQKRTLTTFVNAGRLTEVREDLSDPGDLRNW